MSSDLLKLSVEDIDKICDMVIAGDEKNDLWSATDVTSARHRLVVKFGNVPDLDSLYVKYGKNNAEAILQEVFDNRIQELKLNKALSGIPCRNDICHWCGRSSDKITRHMFYAKKVIKSERNWGASAASIAFAAATVAIIGYGRYSFPEKNSLYKSITVIYSLCNDCQNNRKGLFGKAKLKKSDCKNHPWWPALEHFGFTQIEIPDFNYEKWCK